MQPFPEPFCAQIAVREAERETCTAGPLAIGLFVACIFVGPFFSQVRLTLLHASYFNTFLGRFPFDVVVYGPPGRGQAHAPTDNPPFYVQSSSRHRINSPIISQPGDSPTFQPMP